MDKNTKKMLKIINKLSKNAVVDVETVMEKCNLPKDDFFEISSYLIENEYIKIPRTGFTESSNKGKTYFSVARSKWISEHIIEILALVISISSFIISLIAIICSVQTRQSI